jgi:hypothetical protein
MVRRSLLLRIGFGAITSLGIVLTVLLVLEIGLRIVFARSSDFAMEMWKYAVQLKQPVDDPEVQFEHVPRAHAVLMGVDIHINAFGMRDVDISVEKPSGVYRIMVLGDSTTLGWGVRFEDTTAKLLEKDLGETNRGSSRRVEVLNAGVGNYNTVQEVAWYRRRGRRFGPDLVVLVYFINDAEPLRHDYSGIVLRHSYTIAFLASRIDALLRSAGVRPEWKPYYRSLYDERQPGWPAARGALHALARITHDDGTRLLVAILPELREINRDYPFAEQHKQIRAVVEAEGVPVVDLLEGLKGHGPEYTFFVAPSDSHPNRRANLLIASQLRDWIVRNAIGDNAR